MKHSLIFLVAFLLFISISGFTQTKSFLYLCPVSGGPAGQVLPTNTQVHVQSIRDTDVIYFPLELKKFIANRPLIAIETTRLENFFYIRNAEHLEELANAYDGIYLVGVGQITPGNAVYKSNYLTRSIFKNGFDDYYCKGYIVLLK